MTTIILCGGKGTRLQPIVSDRPKCLAEVNGRPFIFYLLDQLIDSEIKDIILAVNYMGGSVYSVVGTKYRDAEIRYSYDSIEDGGTGHAVRSAIPLIDTGEVLIMNGDTYVALSLLGFIYEVRSGYGNTGFVINVWDSIKNMGIYFTSRDLIAEFIPIDKPYSLEKSFLHDVCSYGLMPHIIDRPYIDIGTPEDYLRATEFMKKYL